jgi:hypothetical protein
VASVVLLALRDRRERLAHKALAVSRVLLAQTAHKAHRACRVRRANAVSVA